MSKRGGNDKIGVVKKKVGYTELIARNALKFILIVKFMDAQNRDKKKTVVLQ